MGNGFSTKREVGVQESKKKEAYMEERRVAGLGALMGKSTEKSKGKADAR